MVNQFNASITRILTATGTVVGAGFLITDKQVITCAHVVALALGYPKDKSPVKMPEEKVYLNFPLLVEGKASNCLMAERKEANSEELTARVIFWRPVTSPSERGSDIAILELESEPPAGSQPCCPMEAKSLRGHRFMTFGFPGGHVNGVSSYGKIQDGRGDGRIMIMANTQGYPVMEGFSGAPVWDEEIDGIVGMVVEAEGGMYDVRAGFMIPTTLLIESWPSLDLLTIPPCCPYRGLSVFKEEHADFFCGRKEFTELLVKDVRQKPLVAVIGSSGSGKSSVVFAGLIPSLRREESWLIASFRPGDQPFLNLAAALMPLLEPHMSVADQIDEGEKLAKILQRKSELLRRKGRYKESHSILQNVIDRIMQKNSAVPSLLLIIDQLEELFTLCRDERERQRFLAILLAVVQAKPYLLGPNLTLVFTLRADFYDHALSFRPMVDALQQAAVHNLGPMTPQELQNVIEKPADKLKVRLQNGLTERILKDIGQSRGKLPLLEFALTQLWKKQKRRELTHAAYAEIGGVEGALVSYADKIYEERFTEEDQERIHRIFIRLVHPGEGTEDTRRQATRTEMGKESWDLVARLVEARLLVSGRNEATGEETVEIAHEALIQEWGRLQEWMKADRAFRTWQERLLIMVHQWKESDQDEGALLRGVPLAEAEDWLRKRRVDLSEAERDFIQAGLALRTREQTAREQALAVQEQMLAAQGQALAAREQTVAAQEQARAAQEQMAAAHEQARVERERMKQRLIIVISVSLVVALILFGFASFQWQRYQRQYRLAFARQLIARAELARKEKVNLLPRSVRLAVKAMYHITSPSLEADQPLRQPLLPGVEIETHTVSSLSLEADQALRQGLALLPRPAAPPIKHENDVLEVAFSPDGQYVATGSEDHTVKIWKVNSGQKVVCLELGQGGLKDLTFSPDGQYLATASDDNLARVWRVREWKAESAQKPEILRHNDNVNAVIFSPNGEYLATASDDHTVCLWETISGQQVRCLSHEDRVTAIAFSPDMRYPDRRYLATASDDGTARLWEVTSGREVSRMPHSDRVTAVVFRPDGKYLATASSDTVQIWRVSSEQESEPSDQKRSGHRGEVVEKFTTLAGHHGSVRVVSFSSDGKCLATAGDDHTILMWDVTGGLRRGPMRHEARVTSVAFNFNGQYLITSSEDGTARVWEAGTGREVIRIAHEQKVNAATFSPNGKYIATASSDQTARIWDTSSICKDTRLVHEENLISLLFTSDGKYLVTADRKQLIHLWEVTGYGKATPIDSPSCKVKALAISPDGKYLIAEAENHDTLQIKDLVSGREIACLPHQGKVEILGFSVDGKYIAVSGNDATLRVWERASQKAISLSHGQGQVKVLVFSPDGKYLAAATSDRTAWIWEVAGGREIARLPHEHYIHTLAFSPEGKHLATAASDHHVWIWEVTSGRKVNCLPHNGYVHTLLFSPDEQYLATAASDHIARIWEVTKSSKATRLTHEGYLQALAFSPDGKYLATASGDHTARVWLWRPEDLIDEACSRLDCQLISEE